MSQTAERRHFSPGKGNFSVLPGGQRRKHAWNVGISLSFNKHNVNQYKVRATMLCYIPDFVLTSSFSRSHLILITALRDMSYYPHFTDENIDSWTVEVNDPRSPSE